MKKRPRKIMVVEPDPALVEVLVGSISNRFDAHITCAVDARTCLDADILDPHDLFVIERDLDDVDGLRLAGQLLQLSRRPIVLLAEEPATDDAVEALRLGVADFFVKPFPVADMLDSMERILYGSEVRAQHAVRYRNLRDLVRRVIRERRDLNRRMELVCRDLVDAHRRLVHRVLASESK